jgi:Matrixin
VGNLPDLRLGATIGGLVLIDSDAAGFGWSLDSAANTSKQMDLFTVVMHEIGHLLGFDHDHDGLMSETLAAGQQKLDLTHNPDSGLSSLISQYAGNSMSGGERRLISWDAGTAVMPKLGWNHKGQRKKMARFPELAPEEGDGERAILSEDQTDWLTEAE